MMQPVGNVLQFKPGVTKKQNFINIFKILENYIGYI